MKLTSAQLSQMSNAIKACQLRKLQPLGAARSSAPGACGSCSLAWGPAFLQASDCQGSGTADRLVDVCKAVCISMASTS